MAVGKQYPCGMVRRDALTGRLPRWFAPLLLLTCWAGATAAPQATKPTPAIKNVLLIVSDDLKASVLGCYGDLFCQTPNIDRLARKGLVFDRAYCQGTSCAPSRQSFMFSRYQGGGEVNLGQHFRENGWYSARVGKIYHMRVPGDIIAGTDGDDVPSSWTERFNSSGREAHTPGEYACLNLNIFSTELAGRQSTKMPHRMFVSVQYDGDGADQPDHKSATRAIELLQQHGAKPFFLAVGLIRPHYPMVAPRQYFAGYPWRKLSRPEKHEEVTRVPLIVSVPGFQSGRTESIVELVDLFPTLSDLAGLQTPQGVQGTSLRPLLANPAAAVKSDALSFHNGTALRTADWAYMRYNDETEELYDMRHDPKQFHNLAMIAEYQDQLNRLRSTLEARVAVLK